ncbi:protoporphyrinogen oxidase [Aeromicrobium terrae]|uniref:Protoporphyrinogen oxidase n=1 Tax=Aeromicrobium terrae TaxID=2498846 RepID=A0A5C8NFV6_9ACTN|nr:protoporphyrinogen oxidase [Aeromicrobium terrae]TXL57418.1 protoporphyrinogen oxidase [Aeromicrobium terrae]
MKKLPILVAFGAGYVLGAKAGRERYEQIQRQSSKVWNSGPVQQGVQEAETVAKQAASAAGEKVVDAATTAGSKVAAKVKGDDAPADPVAEPGPTPDAVHGDPLDDAAKKKPAKKAAKKAPAKKSS